MFELSDEKNTNAVIKVVGVGGGGGNALEHMISENIDGVEFVCANTDLQALRSSKAKSLIQLGEELTKGLGAGADPEIGQKAAEENSDIIRNILSGTDMVFITAGMGGGTGTGAAPVFAEIARQLGILTVAVVTKPFAFEGRKRMTIAEDGIKRLSSHVDSLITIPNNKLLPVLGKNTSLLQAFKAANNVLLGAVQGIAELITRPGLINVDFADVRTVMSERGMAMMGTASSHGENRARIAAETAILSPLLEDVNFKEAGGILVNITAGSNMSIGEFEEVGEVIKSFTSEDATVVVGTVIDQNLTDELRVTIVVTGLGDKINDRVFSNEKRNEKNNEKTNENKSKTVISNNNAQKTNNLERITKSTEGGIDYNKFDKPAILRNAGDFDETEDAILISALDKKIEYFDVPSFLRKEHKEDKK